MRLIEICPTNQLPKERVGELERLCREQISTVLSLDNELPSQQITEPIEMPSSAKMSVDNQNIDAIDAKLDLILEKISIFAADDNSRDIDEDVGSEEDLDIVEPHAEPEKYNKIDYLTPKMVRDQLIRLSHKADLSLVEDAVLSPNEKLLQIAIIEEIIFHKTQEISEIFELPDVNWRYKRYSNSMKKQLETLGKDIQSILDRAVWE